MFFHLYRVYRSCTQKATPAQTGVIDRKKKRILCGAMATAMTVSGYSATVDDSGASVSGCKILKPSPAGEGGPAGPDEG